MRIRSVGALLGRTDRSRRSIERVQRSGLGLDQREAAGERTARDSSLSWLPTVIYVVFVAAAAWLRYGAWRNAGAAGFATPAAPAPEIGAAAPA